MSSNTNLNSVLQFSIKVAIGGAFVAVIFRYVYVDQNLFFYPVLGYLSVMTPAYGGFIQAGWSRVASTFLGGVSVAVTLTSLGDNPLVAAFCYIATLLLCEALQWQGFLTATIVFPIMFIDQVHGQYPWRYAYDRVIYNSVGVLMGILVMLYLWPDKPRVNLSNYLIQILRDTDQEFQAIVVGHLRGKLSSAESEQHLSQMQTLIQQGQSLLENLYYGISGDWYVQDNWSELIAAQERLVRYLSQMKQTFSSEGDNRLWHQNSALLTDLVEQVSTVCTTLISLVSSRKTNQSEIDIPLLSQDIAAIKEQTQQFRTTEDFMALPTSDILRFYAFLDALTSFTEELQQLGSRLHTRQTMDRKRHRIGLSFRLHSIPGDTVKKHLRAGLALGIAAALSRYFNFFGIKQSGLFLGLIAMTLMQPVWGITVDTARTITISLALTFSGCYLLLETLGTNAVAIAILLFVAAFFCSALKLNPIIFRVAPKVGATFMLLYSPTNPATYTSLWNAFNNSFMGVCLALVLSRLFWPTTTPQKIEFSIRQTFTQMGQFYQALADNYLQGAAASEATSFPQSIQQSIQSQGSLQAFTDREVVGDKKVAQMHHEWNFIIGYEKKILDNLLSLQDAIHAHDSGEISQILLLELQEVIQMTAQTFKDLGAAVGFESSQRDLSNLSNAVDAVNQRLENLRNQGQNKHLSLDEIIASSSIILQMKEVTENLNHLMQGLPSSSLLSSNSTSAI